MNTQPNRNQIKQNNASSNFRRPFFAELNLSPEETKFHERLRFLQRLYRLILIQRHKPGKEEIGLEIALRKSEPELISIFSQNFHQAEKEWKTFLTKGTKGSKRKEAKKDGAKEVKEGA